MVRAAIDEQVGIFLMPNIDIASIGPMMALNEKFPQRCLPMFGLHPCDVKTDYLSKLDEIKDFMLRNLEVTVAIGETGLDHYWDMTYSNEQEEALNIQLNWCMEYDLPVVIHSRDSLDAILSILESRKSDGLKGVLHCFSGTREQVERVNKLDFYFGLGGVLTFKNGGLDKVIHDIPTNRIILETDAPYLAPVPYRGKRNEPVYIRKVAEKLAEMTRKSVDEIERITTQNAVRLFGIKQLPNG